MASVKPPIMTQPANPNCIPKVRRKLLGYSSYGVAADLPNNARQDKRLFTAASTRSKPKPSRTLSIKTAMRSLQRLPIEPS